jgi:hypothetical protein
MRSLLVAITVVLLATAPLGSLTVWAQETDGFVDEAWLGVTINEDAAPMAQLNEFLGTSGSLRERIKEGHRVTFDNSVENPNQKSDEKSEAFHAHIPEIPDAEFMAVYVSQGEFVLDVMPPTSFIVDPAGDRTISLLENTGSDPNEAYYELNEGTAESLRDEKGDPCTEMCTVPAPRADGQVARQDERTAIQLLPGDWILAPAGGLCVWCLLNTWAVPGTMGELFVYPLSDEDFAWAQAKSAFMASAIQGTPGTEAVAADQGASVSSERLSNFAAWAFFNPAPNCRTG